VGREDHEVAFRGRAAKSLHLADMGRSMLRPYMFVLRFAADFIYFFSEVGAGRRGAGTEGTAIERAPFFPTARTAKK
jgi:hypothetical protein